jgi:hypothetical protein
MNLRELDYQTQRRDHLALSALDRRLRQADQHADVRTDVLQELQFIKGGRRPRLTKLCRELERQILNLPAMPSLVAAIAFGIVLWILGLLDSFKEYTFIFPLLAAVVAYQNWRRARLNSTVDDALKRKDMANALIMQNPELLRRYVQSALYGAPSTEGLDYDHSDNTKIDMYIYSEIDNLEFVFSKSNHDLIDDEFVIRAIKIFIARNENRLFRARAKDLVGKGRYNHDFRSAAERLLLVAEWRQLNAGRWD